jgi:hypothetical protein
MTRPPWPLAGVLPLVAGIVACAAVAAHTDEATLSVAIQIQPSTLVVSRRTAPVTVHAEIAYSAVNASSVGLGGIPASSTLADDRGELVAKFPGDVVSRIVAPGHVTLALTGTTRGGDAFVGIDTVTVR